MTALDSDPAEQLRARIAQLLQDMLVPGAVVLFDKPGFTFERAFGTRDRTNSDLEHRVSFDDHFRIGSNTKTMTATVVLQLVADPQVDLALDDPVAKHLSLPNGDVLAEVTVRDLLVMRSSLYNYSDSLSFNQRLDDPATTFDIDELIQEGLRGPREGSPGGEFHYSNTNTALLGKIVEKYDRTSLRDSLQRRIFGPLALRNTSLPAGDDRSMPPGHPRGYMYGTNVSTLVTMALSPADQERARNGTLAPNDYTSLTPTWTWAAGGGISNARDLASYVRVLVEGGFLPDALQEERLNSVEVTDPSDPMSAGYGLGIAKFGPMYGHDGTLPGYQSFMGHDPLTHSTLIVLTSLSAAPDGRGTANEVAKLILQP